MIFDTHSHYNMDPLRKDWLSHWQKGMKHGVDKAIVVGADLPSSEAAIALAAINPSFKAAVAVHPGVYQEFVENHQPSQVQIDAFIERHVELISKLASDKNVAAIGETGLDYFRLPADETQISMIKATQQAAFKAHLTIATKANLPVIIHVRDQGESAYQDVLELLSNRPQTNQPFILHCASGPLNYIKAAVDLGAYLGMAGNITYKSAELVREIARHAPPDRLLLETDAPFFALSFL